MNRIVISVVVPVYNEKNNIQPLYKSLKKELDIINEGYEIIFVDDGSFDNSLSTLHNLSKKDKKVKIMSFSRNFGQMAAIEAGLRSASGKYIVTMDADLQDPPSVIKKMYQKALTGYEVVYGIKKKRKESYVRKFLFNSFYRTLNAITTYDLPLDAGTFSLQSKRVVDIIVDMPEKNKYFSGLRAWTGFTQTGIVYKRDQRYSGKPASFRRLFQLALDGIFSFSYIPLRLASLFGFIFASIAIVSIFFVVAARIFFGFGIVGWTSTMSIILLASGVQLITLGLIGEYLARIYDEVKNRPEYIVKEKSNF